MSDISRRRFVKVIGQLGVASTLASVGVSALWHVGCQAEDGAPGDGNGADDGNGAGPAADDVEERVNATMRIAWRDQTSLIASGERCSVTASLLAALGARVGDQLRVYRPRAEGAGERERVALFTIAMTHDTEADATVRIGRTGRERLGAADDDTLTVELSTRVAHPGLDAVDARDNGEYVETLDDDGNATGVFIAAPHGGAIEFNTDKQAARVHERLSDVGHAGASTCWRCVGYRDTGAYAAWHITSTELSKRSFAGLGTVADRGYRHAVAFHGHSGDDLIVGGAASMARKQAMAAAITAALDGTDNAAVAVNSGALSGTSGANFVNWVTADGESGIQIEQPRAVRKDHWEAVADAVADELAAWLAE